MQYEVDQIVKVRQAGQVVEARVMCFSSLFKRYVLCPPTYLDDGMARLHDVAFYADAADMFPTGRSVERHQPTDLVVLRKPGFGPRA